MAANDTGLQRTQKVYGLCRRINAAERSCHILLVQFLQEKAQERADHAAQVLQTKETQNQVVQFLPDDLLFKIFISLPAESLSRIQFVCKRWLSLISNPTFIRLHAQQSKTLLICQKLAFEPKHADERPQSYFHFMDLDHAKNNFVHSNVNSMVSVLSSCDGLVLVRRKHHMTLVLMNPITRKYTELPPNLSTTSAKESYSLAFCDKDNTYKVVHLFSERPGYIGCGILSISTRKWKLVEGFSSRSLPNDRSKIVFVNGSMYWMPPHHREFFVTLNLQVEKFITRKFPTRHRIYDKLLDIGGVLGFVTHETRHLMEVWILKENGDESNTNWIKRCSINLSLDIRCSAVPICSPNGKGIVFCYTRGHHLYVYDFDKGDTTLVYSRDDAGACHESMDKLYIPHQNTLVSWENKRESSCEQLQADFAKNINMHVLHFCCLFLYFFLIFSL